MLTHPSLTSTCRFNSPGDPKLGLLFSVSQFPRFFPALEFSGENSRRTATGGLVGLRSALVLP